MPTIVIDAAAKLHTVINVFHTSPDRQAALLQALTELTETVARRRPGFVAASFHRGHDGARVANYAQWRSKAEYDAFLANPEARAAMGGVMRLVDRLEHGTYEVASTHAPA